MYDTKYHKPASLDDAVAALGSAEEGKVLSGGQTLIPTMKITSTIWEAPTLFIITSGTTDNGSWLPMPVVPRVMPVSVSWKSIQQHSSLHWCHGLFYEVSLPVV